MGYGLDGPGGEANFLLSIASRPVLGPTQTTIHWVLGAIYPGIKWPGPEADHSPPSSVEVKNGGAIPPLPHMSSWRGKGKSYPRNRPLRPIGL
jgi:hypothetical protein